MNGEGAVGAPYPADVLLRHGLCLPAPEQVYVDRSVNLDRVAGTVTLYPGCRVIGARTVLADGVVVGSEGPATLVDCAFGRDAEIASGYAERAVLLDHARLGNAAHVRPTTLLEEHASTAHAVGLKQTVLMSFVTLGSLINACDLLIAGGTSRDAHTEVGSGFIHFNFTPWGKTGDKATASLVGDVVKGALLRSPKIFLGGLGGVVGPLEVGYGSVTVAGQVVRRRVGDHRLVANAQRAVDQDVRNLLDLGAQPDKVAANFRFIAQLCALLGWYRHVRSARVEQEGGGRFDRLLLQEAGVAIEAMIEERLVRLAKYCAKRGDLAPVARALLASVQAQRDRLPAALLATSPGAPHVQWVQALADADAAAAGDWLNGVYEQALEVAQATFPT